MNVYKTLHLHLQEVVGLRVPNILSPMFIIKFLLISRALSDIGLQRETNKTIRLSNSSPPLLASSSSVSPPPSSLNAWSEAGIGDHDFSLPSLIWYVDEVDVVYMIWTKQIQMTKCTIYCMAYFTISCQGHVKK